MKRVMVVDDDHLLCSGIQSLLARETSMQVVSISSGDSSGIDQQIDSLPPDFLIVDESWRQPAQVPLLTFLDKHPAVKVAVINNRDNSVSFYSTQKIFLSDAHDLVEAIRRN